jgi:acyl-CoA dehydrogenase
VTRRRTNGVARAGAPGLIPLGLRMLAPVLLKYGTDEQKRQYLPRILPGEHYWCQGYSEPGSGSDLSSLRTRAVCDGDDYVVNGTKIWITHAQFADHIFCLVRTNDLAKPQAGISFTDRHGHTPHHREANHHARR